MTEDQVHVKPHLGSYAKRAAMIWYQHVTYNRKLLVTYIFVVSLAILFHWFSQIRLHKSWRIVLFARIKGGKRVPSTFVNNNVAASIVRTIYESWHKHLNMGTILGL